MWYRVTKTLTIEEHPWLPEEIVEGTIVKEYDKSTYGCISELGCAIQLLGRQGFYEVPLDALEVVFLKENTSFKC